MLNVLRREHGAVAGKRLPLMSLPLVGRNGAACSTTGAIDAATSSALCDPVLLLGILPGINAELGDIYRNDLVYSRTSQWKKNLPCELGDGALLHILHYLDGGDLLKLREVYKGTVVIDNSLLYDESGNVQGAVLDTLKQLHFKAIVVADNCISKGKIGDFVRKQYENHEVNVVVMAIEGTFDLGYLRDFGVSWQTLAYTKRCVHLTESGRKVLGAYAFPFESQHCKSLFVVGDGHELFANHIVPEPGSPVIVHRNPRGRCISYFGFVNSLDVSFGAILLRLCYADVHL